MNTYQASIKSGNVPFWPTIKIENNDVTFKIPDEFSNLERVIEVDNIISVSSGLGILHVDIYFEIIGSERFIAKGFSKSDAKKIINEIESKKRLCISNKKRIERNEKQLMRDEKRNERENKRFEREDRYLEREEKNREREEKYKNSEENDIRKSSVENNSIIKKEVFEKKVETPEEEFIRKKKSIDLEFYKKEKELEFKLKEKERLEAESKETFNKEIEKIRIEKESIENDNKNLINKYNIFGYLILFWTNVLNQRWKKISFIIILFFLFSYTYSFLNDVINKRKENEKIEIIVSDLNFQKARLDSILLYGTRSEAEEIVYKINREILNLKTTNRFLKQKVENFEKKFDWNYLESVYKVDIFPKKPHHFSKFFTG